MKAGIAALLATAAAAFALNAASSTLTFDATFAGGSIAPFAGSQCANTGTPPAPPRWRGDLNVSPAASLGIPSPSVGPDAAQIVDGPATGSGYSLVQCELLTPSHPLPLGQTLSYGMMIYEPAGWSIPNTYTSGTNIEEVEFQGVYGAPLTWQLHGDESPTGPHITLQVETGACQPLIFNQQHKAIGGGGCQDRSNADAHTCRNSSTVTCLPGYYLIPPAGVNGSPGFVEGQWNEVVMTVDWSQTSGSVQTWYRTLGATTWTAGDSVTGIPTVQWRAGQAPYANSRQIIESYTGSVTAPFSVYLDNVVEAPTLAAVEAAMP